jgi:nucleotide-binding universal stress UspA family protein
MTASRCVLCPIDYSDASAGALRYAAEIAERLEHRLVVLTVEDPLLTTAMDLGTGVYWTPELSKSHLQEFVAETLGRDRGLVGRCEYDVTVGKPPVEILRAVRHRPHCGVIVMGSHGLTGARKLFFGSTTERVLRETTVPVLVTPASDRGPSDIHAVPHGFLHIAVPVDLSASSRHQVRVAERIARALDTHLLLIHVIEPVRSRLLPRVNVTGLNASRRALAEDAMQQLTASLSPGSRAEALIVYGDPAEETAKVIRDRRAGLVVMGLHGSPLLGPRMGSVTYRILCLSSVPVLALPPAAATSDAEPIGVSADAREGR